MRSGSDGKAKRNQEGDSGCDPGAVSGTAEDELVPRAI